MDKGAKLPWAADVDPRDYASALDFLSLYWLPDRAREAVAALREAPMVEYLPGDVLRAAAVAEPGLTPLPLDDPGVKRELVRALEQGQISPILCINLDRGMVIADGHHRASLAYALAPFRKIPMRLA